jgi:hypothetical protein
MAWGVHSAAECRLGASRKAEGKGKENDKPKQDKPLTYVAAAATIAGGPGFAAFLSKLANDEE